MKELQLLVRQPRAWCGLALCVIGIVASRTTTPNIRAIGLASAIYLGGIALALAGLALLASAMKIETASVITCPECLSVNPVDAVTCRRCKASLREVKIDHTPDVDDRS